MKNKRLLNFITLSLLFSNYLTLGNIILGRESDYLLIAMRAATLALMSYGTYFLFERAIKGIWRELRTKGLKGTIISTFSRTGINETEDVDDEWDDEDDM